LALGRDSTTHQRNGVGPCARHTFDICRMRWQRVVGWTRCFPIASILRAQRLMCTPRGAMRPVVHKSGSLCVFRMYGRKYDLLAQARIVNSRLCAPVLPMTRGIWKSMKASWPIYANRSAPPATGRARFSPSRSKERVSFRRPEGEEAKSETASRIPAPS